MQKLCLRDFDPEFFPGRLVGRERNQMQKAFRRQGIFVFYSLVRHCHQMSCERRPRDLFRDPVVLNGHAIAFPGPNKGSGENLGKVILGG